MKDRSDKPEAAQRESRAPRTSDGANPVRIVGIVTGAIGVLGAGIALRFAGLAWERVALIVLLVLAAAFIALFAARILPPTSKEEAPGAGYTRGRGRLARSLARGQCPACGYSIVGLPDLVCPECGVDARDSLTALGFSPKEIEAFRADASRAPFGGDRGGEGGEERASG